MEKPTILKLPKKKQFLKNLTLKLFFFLKPIKIKKLDLLKSNNFRTVINLNR